MARDSFDGRFVGALCAVALTGAPAHGATVCTAGPIPIPDDASTVVVPLAVAEAGAVASVRVDLDVTHEWVGDLRVELAKDGVVVCLLDRMSLGTYPFGCGGDDVLATFTDDAAVTPEDLCSPTVTPVIAGDVLPVDALGAFAGVEASGAWELRITDAGAFDAGTLGSACLTLTLAPPSECAGDLDGDGDTDVFDFGIFSGSFGSAVAPGTGGDLDGNGVVDVFDFGIFGADFGCTP